VDPYDLADPVDILPKLDAEWWTNSAEKKWQLRKEAMEKLVGISSTIKIQPGDFANLIGTLKKIIDKDANVAVMVEAVKVCGNLANGLRTSFSAHAKALLPSILEKLKEKKQAVLDVIHATLDAIIKSKCFTLGDITEELGAALAHKTPMVKCQALLFITRNFATTAELQKPAIKFFGENILKCIDDSNAEVREFGYKAFGALHGVVSEKPLLVFFRKNG